MTVTWDQGPIDAKMREAALRAVVAGVEAIVTEGTRLIASPPKTGRIYTRRGIKHQASAPGQPPATDTGMLMASGKGIYPDQQGLFTVTGWANWSTAYARFLELGTEKMAPRPYARPALDTCAPVFIAALAGELRVNGGGR